MNTKTKPITAVKQASLQDTDGWALVEWTDLQAEHPLREFDAASLGHHLLVELYDCDSDALCGVERIQQMMLDAARASRASVVSHHFHSFKPYGVSGAVIIQESHFTIHTWPEHRYAAIDLFYCSEDVEVDKAIEVMKEILHPERVNILHVRRGKV